MAVNEKLFYFFSHDLRKKDYPNEIIDVAKTIQNDMIPSLKSGDKKAKSKLNVIRAMECYFNIGKDSSCNKLCLNGNVDLVLFNFINKFQYPNPIDKNNYEKNLKYGMQVAPLRMIVKVLVEMNVLNLKKEAYLTSDEIDLFVFRNVLFAKNLPYHIGNIIKDILDYRESEQLPDYIVAHENVEWSNRKRQEREMLDLMQKCGCIIEKSEDINKYYIGSQFTTEKKAILYDIINENDFWSYTSPKEENDLEEGNSLDLKEENNLEEGNSLDPKEENDLKDKTDFNEIKKSYSSYVDNGLSTYIVQFDEKTNELTIKEENKISSLKSKEFNTDLPRNLIVFGAPGTGKSYYLNQKINEPTQKINYERVTFYPDYSYANFVGVYKPIPDGTSITYKYVPGPFIRTFIKAVKSMLSEKAEAFALIIEEINRADAASVFGDTFQLLDRDEKGCSKYPIECSEDLQKYLAEEIGGNADDYKEIFIPSNMIIWATMNSADQGVFTLDTAFKRRWDFEYICIDKNEEDILDKTVEVGSIRQQRVNWNSLRKSINKWLVNNKVNEDKQLGPYFLSREIVVPETGTEINKDFFKDAFENKVLMYLFEDAAKGKAALFETTSDRSNRIYSDICNEFEENGIFVFNKEIRDQTDYEELK